MSINDTHYRSLRFLSRGHFLPLLLLLLALSTVFLFGNDRRGYFYKPYDDHESTFTLELSANLSPDHNFLLFYDRTLNDGATSIVPYSRYPIGTYALVKLTILPFEDDKATSLYAARLLMLLLFAATAVLAYFALYRLTSDPWIALTATALSFSSFYWMYYKDIIFSQLAPGMFGIVLTFHGMVIFMQEGRFRQLLVKSCVALLLCWPVMSLLLPFIVLGLAHEMVHSYAANSLLPLWSRMRSVAASLLSSRYLILGVVALLFCALLMAFNFTNEYRALDVPLAQLPTIQSMLMRLSINPVLLSTYSQLDWQPFLREQFFRITVMSTPFALFSLFGYPALEIRQSSFPDYLPYLGIVIFGVCLLGLIFVRHKILMATLLLAGWCWVLPLRSSTGIHIHDALVFIGIPLVFFLNGASSLLFILKRLSHRLSRYLIAGLAVATLLVFVLSNFSIASDSFGRGAIYKDIAADLATIRKITEGKNVFNPRITFPLHNLLKVNSIIDYYLTNTFIDYNYDIHYPYDYLILDIRIDGDALLTPENRHLFLYNHNTLSLFDAYSHRMASIMSAEPVLHSNFDIYLSENVITYVKEACQQTDTQAPFFMHIIPIDTNDPLDHREQHGDHFYLDFDVTGLHFDGKCLLHVNLPEYDIDHIVTGQFIFGEDTLWRGEFSVREHKLTASEIHALELEYESIVSAEPVLRSNFDIYLSENVITYVKEACQETDTQAKFFLHIFPVDTNDLPAHRLQHGFDNFDFTFYKFGLRFNGKCLLHVNLPEYDINHIVTGQFISGEDTLWRGEFSVREHKLTASGIDALELEYESIVSAEPVLRSNFDIYLSENVITYVKEACQETDTQVPFFWHIFPVDTNDLPAHRQQYGFDNFGFTFYKFGLRFNGKCLLHVNLPEYDIDRMVTGQFISGQGKLWEGEFSIDE